MRTVVPDLTQKILAISRPLHPSLPPERSLRSAHRLSAELRRKIGRQFHVRHHQDSVRRVVGARKVTRGGQKDWVTELSHDGDTVCTSGFGVLFLFFTGRGDSFLSPKRERKEWGRKTYSLLLIFAVISRILSCNPDVESARSRSILFSPCSTVE